MLIVDTGVLVAATYRTDRAHRACVDLLQSPSRPLVTTAMVIAESAYLIERELGTDAGLIAIAERLCQTTIATLDPRRFAVVRPAHGEAFHLVP